MKICPKCQTKYTDDTLNFCLQDGKTLDLVSDEKTLILDADSFADDATITDNVANISSGKQGNEESTEKQFVVPTADNQSKETVLSPKKTNEDQRNLSSPQRKGRGLSFIGGFVLAFILLGIAGTGIFAVWSYSRKNVSNDIGNSNTNISVPIREKILRNITISSSSTRRSEKGNSYSPKLALDGNPRTAWAEGAIGPGVGQWIAFDFEKEVVLKKLVIMPGYFKTRELWSKNNRVSSAVLEFSDKLKKTVSFSNKMEEQVIDLSGIKTKSVLIRIKGYYPGRTDRKDTLISEVKFIVE